MEFEENEIVQVKPGMNDQGHGNEKGRVIQIKTDPVVLIADYPNSGESEKGAYEVAFPPIERWTDSKWYFEDQLEKI